tara:strand:- start:92 stop:331 length:240 start_codon:yes stop_codon:yes gene_type:complete
MQTLGLPEHIKHSAISMLVFLAIAAPMTYKLTDSLTRQVGFRLAEGNGCPTLLGLVVHALVFALISDLLYATLFVGLDM